MKKLLMFLCCVFALNVTNGFAGCKVLNCDRNGDFVNGYVSTHIGGTQCWWCGPGENSCNHNDIVSVKDEFGDVVWLYQCNRGFSNKFSSYTPDEFCKNSPIKNKQAQHAKVTYSVTEGKATVASALGDFYFNDGSASCVYMKCEEGYKPSSDKKSCVSVAESECTRGGGKWVNNGCDCTHKGDYEWNAAQKKCVLNAVGRQKQQDEQNRQRQQQQREQQKNDCINTGGDYKNSVCTCSAEKNLVVSNGICECKNVDYKFVNAATGCVEKDESIYRRNCENAVSAGEKVQWNGTSCVCIEPDMEYYGGKCHESASMAKCNGAADTKWVSTTKECKCVKAGYEWNGEACVESEESKNQAAAASLTMRIRQLNTKIAGKLDGWHKNLNVWKTAEGDFNTARLASDSIAGVVLGTAGGLITSHVVKKGQIKNGFEDINCAIGGQNVAGWHDEFTVGIK